MKKTTILNKDIKQIESDVQRDLTFYLILNLRHEELSMTKAQLLARDFLAIFPIQTLEDLLRKLNKLSERYHEARAVFIEYANSYYEDKKKKVLEIVPDYIRNKQIEEALTLVKGGTYHV